MSLVMPFTFSAAGLKTPTSRLDANFQTIVDWFNTTGAGTLGLIAERPDPTLGHLYVATDQAHLWYMGDGTAWHPVGRAGDGTIDLDPVTGTISLFGAALGTDAARVLALAAATALPTGSPPTVAQWYVTDTQGVADRAAWHHRSGAGWVTPLNPCLYRTVGNPVVTVGNTAAETACWPTPPTLQGGTLTAGRGLELFLAFDTLNNSGATRTLTLRTKLGGTTLTSSVITLPASGTRKEATIRYRYDARTDLSQVADQASYEWTTLATQVLTLTPGAVDAGVDQPIAVTVQCSAAFTTLDVRVFTLMLTLV